jgi:hypothetical protein
MPHQRNSVPIDSTNRRHAQTNQPAPHYLAIHEDLTTWQYKKKQSRTREWHDAGSARYVYPKLRRQSRSEREGVRRAIMRGSLRLLQVEGISSSLSCKRNLECTCTESRLSYFGTGANDTHCSFSLIILVK